MIPNVTRRVPPGKATASAMQVLPGEPRQCSRARELVRTILWERENIVRDAELVVSELFGNGCRHTRSGEPGGTLSVTVSARTDGLVAITVTDQGPSLADEAIGRRRVPTIHAPAEESEEWRGLRLVAALTDAWGHTPVNEGSLMVWALFNFPADDPNGYPALRC